MAAIGEWVKGYTVVCGTYGHQLFGFNLSADLVGEDGHVIQVGGAQETERKLSQKEQVALEAAEKAAAQQQAVQRAIALQDREATKEWIDIDFEGSDFGSDESEGSSDEESSEAEAEEEMEPKVAEVEEEEETQEEAGGEAAPIAGLSFGFEPVFGFAAHTKAVTCLGRDGRWLLSGSDDERVNIYDMATRREFGALLKQNGSISDIVGVEGHVLTASSDGTIVMWSQKDWEAVHTLKGHNGPITNLSVHPSGKLLLSVGQDSTLRLWDLKVGRQLLSEKLRSPAHLVDWSASGLKFAYARENVVVVRDTASNEVIATVPSYKFKKDRKTGSLTYSKSSPEVEWYMETGDARPWSAKSLKKSLDDMWRVNALGFLGDDLVYLGGESRRVDVVDITTGEEVLSLSGHSNRVKAVATLPHPSADVDGEDDDTEALPMFVTASTDGKLRLFDPAEEEPLAEFDTMNRITALSVVPPLSGAVDLSELFGAPEGSDEEAGEVLEEEIDFGKAVEVEEAEEKRTAGKTRKNPSGEGSKKKKTKTVTVTKKVRRKKKKN